MNAERIYFEKHAGRNDFDLRLDVIRVVAMCSVVWGHCLMDLDDKNFAGLYAVLLQSSLLQLGRVGTLLFFLISGFLIADKIKRFTVVSYLQYRFSSTILPWLVFVSLLVLIQLFITLPIDQIFLGSKRKLIALIFEFYKGDIFHAAYWFIPVVIISCVILIIFKTQLQKNSYGTVLALITTFYGINLYLSLIPANHTTAFLGYAFFVWLGVIIKKRAPLILRVIEMLPWKIVVPIFLIAFFLSCREGMILTYNHSEDPYASIRISNIILSLIIFFSLLKTHKFWQISYLKPRQYAFGVYLIHSIIIVLSTPFVNQVIRLFNLNNSLSMIVLTRLAFFTMILLTSYLLVNLIRKTPLCFLIGRRKSQ
ncbi:acyltransferase family protein [Mucilaginibacter calamicampi]|uniref:Acyltransferase family protein n=1 Tax=Mucilaginibacter calamicampi TaxID=1302352 RepID=A0ABW2YV09_9SPHI